MHVPRVQEKPELKKTIERLVAWLERLTAALSAGPEKEIWVHEYREMRPLVGEIILSIPARDINEAAPRIGLTKEFEALYIFHLDDLAKSRDLYLQYDNEIRPSTMELWVIQYVPYLLGLVLAVRFAKVTAEIRGLCAQFRRAERRRNEAR